MKKGFVLFFLISLLPTTILAQSIKLGKFKWKDVVLMQRVNIENNNWKLLEIFEKDEGLEIKNEDTEKDTIEVDTQNKKETNNFKNKNLKVPSKVNQIFRVVSINKDKALIRILDYTRGVNKKDSTEKEQNLQIIPTTNFFTYNFTGNQENYEQLSNEKKNARDYGIYQAYFEIDTDFLYNYAIEDKYIASSLGAGVINIPFKYRFYKGSPDFSGSFNFGAGISWNFSHKSWKNFTHSVLLAYNVTNINLDTSSVYRNASDLTSANNFIGLSLSLGYLIQYDKVQVGIFTGVDRLPRINQQRFGWIYQGKPWISIGLGFAIFSAEKEKEKNKPEQ